MRNKGDLIKRLKGLLPHVCIVMSGMLVVFFVIDQMNHHIHFMTNEFHKWITFFLALGCITESILYSGVNRRLARAKKRRPGAGRQAK